MKIEFTNHNPELVSLLPPEPASRFMPEWYKNMSNYMSAENKKKPDGNGSTTGTVKTCMPFLDMLTAGYIIPTACDVYVSIKDGKHWFEWTQNEQVTFHSAKQINAHPDFYENKDAAAPKFTNSWGIKTPKGYSCLFITPTHRESPFKLFEGIVDTDTYTLPVNLPFLLKDEKWEGLIPAGTPMVQVIPFRRDNWDMSIKPFNQIEHLTTLSLWRRKIFDSYKTQFWQKKNFR